MKRLLVLAGVGLFLCSGPVAASAATFTYSGVRVRAAQPTTVMNANDRAAAGLSYWPDGTMGVIPARRGYTFVAANGSVPGLVSGTLNSPAKHGAVNVPIGGVDPANNYASGGPIYRDGRRWYMLYHAERWPNGQATAFMSSVGLALSRDNGHTWANLGDVIRPYRPYASSSPALDVGGAAFITHGGYLYAYFRDPSQPTPSFLSVARTRLRDLPTGGIWHNYFKGRWTQPSLGGRSHPLETGNPSTRWFDFAFNSRAHRYIMVVSARSNPTGATNLYMATSRDGLHWSPRRQLTRYDTAEAFYPTLIGTGRNPKTSGRHMILYFTYADPGGWERWPSAELRRIDLAVSRR